eukprot:GILJ01012977.1.p1 GENE.GILJ01012977.1~~GILJ01012977.1.p1  ORF type:complete len:446 (+),score=73.73 GILJ01012977.1:163-1338(+)
MRVSDDLTKQRCSQSEIVHRAIAILLHNEVENVLTLGYRKKRFGSEAGVRHLRDVESFFPNTTVNLLKNESWETLLSRIGDDMMLSILCQSTILLSLPRQCYLQVAGPILSQLVYSKTSKHEKPRRSRQDDDSIESESTHGRTARDLSSVLIPRHSIFYNSHFNKRPGLPQRHPLNTLPPSLAGAAELASTIFKTGINRESDPEVVGQVEQVVPLLRGLLTRHRRCPYAQLLASNCPLPQGFTTRTAQQLHSVNRLADSTMMNLQKKRKHLVQRPSRKRQRLDDMLPHAQDIDSQLNGSSESDEEEGYYTQGEDMEHMAGLERRAESKQNHLASYNTDLVNQVTPQFNVASFIRQVCSCLLPKSLLGSKKNRKLFSNSSSSILMESGCHVN